MELFATRGFDATTIKDIGEAADVAPGLIYHYFESKEELLSQVVEYHGFNAEIERILQGSFDKPATEELIGLAHAFYTLIGEKEQILKLFVREAMVNPKLHERWCLMCNVSIMHLSRYLAARVAAGELRPHNTEVSARMLLQPLIMLKLTGDGTDRIPELIENLLFGILPQRGGN